MHRLGIHYSLLLLILLCGFAGTQAVCAADLSSSTERIAGKTRIETALLVSQKGWPEAATVILARADDFPDSLVAVPLAHNLDAPILLTYPSQLDPQVLAEIERLGAGHVVILGSARLMGDNITAVLDKEDISWERIGGIDRYDTAVQVAKRLGSTSRVILASGENFPDALAISPYAGITETPILLTQKLTMPDVTKKEIMELIAGNEAPETLVIGGEGVIPGVMLTGLPGVQRIAGNNRYETAAKVYWFSEELFEQTRAYLTTGENFPDGLVVGALAAKEKAPLFLSDPTGLPAMTYSALRGYAGIASATVSLIGGTSVLSERVEKMVEGTIQPPYLLTGLTIAVDAGHGGKDPGATGFSGISEKNNTLPVALSLAEFIRSAGGNALLTRATDVPPTGSDYTQEGDLEARVNIANKAGADLFVSIHNDAFSDPTVGGTSTFYSSANPQVAESRSLAGAVQNELLKQLSFNDRKVKDASFYVLRNTVMPAILVELGFITNPDEEKLLSSPDFQKKAAGAIYRGILTFEKY
ncbi:MAG TPA: N-acetylmuramoyl-L-alanine amidase [Desulfitobacteriaceae bacterium]|nr:N-acetylmuramoyl-L-alanine amidase [Desulfitobacteriaceae bacterium]